jgi:hypothetical protein
VEQVGSNSLDSGNQDIARKAATMLFFTNRIPVRPDVGSNLGHPNNKSATNRLNTTPVHIRSTRTGFTPCNSASLLYKFEFLYHHVLKVLQLLHYVPNFEFNIEILGWILERWDGVMWTALVRLRIGKGGELL